MKRLTGIQERLEASDLGRIVISALIVVALVVIVVANLPDSYLKSRLSDLSDPAIKATGLVQVWGVFAPDPRRQAVDIVGRVQLADGSVETWNDPQTSPLFGDYWVYRWRKYMEWAIAEPYRYILWRPTAVWLARRAVREGKQPVVVTLIRRWSDLNPPGTHPARSPWKQTPYYRLRVTPQVLKEISA